MPLQFDASKIEATQIEQVINQSHHVRHLSVHHAVRVFDGHVIALGQARDFQRVPNGSERITKFVCQCCNKLVFSACFLKNRQFVGATFRHITRRTRDGFDITGGIDYWHENVLKRFSSKCRLI